MTPFIAELIGTAIMILLGAGVVANVVLKDTQGYNSGWIVITTGWALAVYIGVVIAAPYSGAHLNPAVTIGLAASDSFPWSDAPIYILAQFLGAMIGASVVWVFYKNHLILRRTIPLKKRYSVLPLRYEIIPPILLVKPLELLCWYSLFYISQKCV